MATFTLKIDDELLAKYQGHNPKMLVQKNIEAALERFQDISADQRAVIFPNEVRKELEHLYGKTIEDPKKFVEWVRNLVSIKVLGVNIPMRDGQRKRLQAEATFWRQPFESYVTAKVTRWIERELGGF